MDSRASHRASRMMTRTMQESPARVFPFIPFSRLVREIGQDFGSADLKWEPGAIAAIDTIIEYKLVDLLRAANLVAITAIGAAQATADKLEEDIDEGDFWRKLLAGQEPCKTCSKLQDGLECFHDHDGLQDKILMSLGAGSSNKQACEAPAGSAASGYDPSTDPLAFIGTEVRVKWENKKRTRIVGTRSSYLGSTYYRGRVDAYDAEKKLHHVVYEDGDTRWYTASKTHLRTEKGGHAYAIVDQMVREYAALRAAFKKAQEEANHTWIESKDIQLVRRRGALADMGLSVLQVQVAEARFDAKIEEEKEVSEGKDGADFGAASGAVPRKTVPVVKLKVDVQQLALA